MLVLFRFSSIEPNGRKVVADFIHGRTNTERLDRPKEVVTHNINIKINKIVLVKHEIKFQEVPTTLKITKERVAVTTMSMCCGAIWSCFGKIELSLCLSM